MKKRIYIITFLAVAAVIFVIGYAGMEVALKYWQKQYIKIQMDVNRRQAELMSDFLSNEIKSGLSQDKVIKKLQNSLVGTEADKGYLCMFDKTDAQLLCHPNKKMLGMKIPESMKFEDNINSRVEKTYDVITKGEGRGGLFHNGDQIEIAYMIPVKGTPWMLSVHENIGKIKAEVKKQRELFSIGFIVLSIITAFFATFMARLVARKYEKKIEEQNDVLEQNNEELNVLNTSLNQQKEEILTQNEEILTQKNFVTKNRDKILHQKNQIVASIQYASRIQRALLPLKTDLENLFPDYFIIFKPRDIVSGDFYWAKQIDNYIIFAAADSTGHGVPGAFMSMLGISYLNEIVSDDFYKEQTFSASQILNDLRAKVISSLKQDDSASSTKDGMDISLIVINKDTLELQFAGAYNPLYIIRDGNFVEVEADRMPVGIHALDENDFTNKRIDLVKDDCLYLFSDGYPDQFGGEKNRKFLKKNFKKVIQDNASLPMSMQEINLEESFVNWKKECPQVDDVIVVGIRV